MEDLKELLELIDKKKKLEEVYNYAYEEYNYWHAKSCILKNKLGNLRNEINEKTKSLMKVVKPVVIEEILVKNDNILKEKLGENNGII